MTEPPPLPIQQLNYSDPARDGASMIVAAISLAGIAFGSLHLVYSAAQLAPAILNGNARGGASVSFGLTLDFSRPLNILMLCLEVIEDASAIALITGAAGLRTLRPWASSTVIAALVAFSAAYLVGWVCRMIEMLSNVPFSRTWTPAVSATYVLMSAASVGGFLLMPALILWLLTRPGVRRFQGGLGSM